MKKRLLSPSRKAKKAKSRSLRWLAEVELDSLSLLAASSDCYCSWCDPEKIDPAWWQEDPCWCAAFIHAVNVYYESLRTGHNQNQAAAQMSLVYYYYLDTGPECTSNDDENSPDSPPELMYA